MSLQMQSQPAQSRHKMLVALVCVSGFAVANSYGSWFYHRSFVLFGCHFFYFGKDLIRRQNPVHRNGVAPFSGTTQPQWTVAVGSTSDLDFPPREEITANETVTFFT